MNAQDWPEKGEYAGDEVNTGLIGMVGVFSAVVLLLIVILLQAWFHNWKEDLAAVRQAPADPRETPVGRMLAEQEQQLGTYRWVNRQAGVRAIPIERAMEVVAVEMTAEQKGGKQEPEKGGGG